MRLVEPTGVYFGEASGGASTTGRLIGGTKQRLQLKDDTTHRFSIDVMGHWDQEGKATENEGRAYVQMIDWTANKNWVPLKLGDKYYKAEIASLAKRMGIDKTQLLKLYQNKSSGKLFSAALEKAFFESFDSYQGDLTKIQKALTEITKSGHDNQGILTLIKGLINDKEGVKDPYLRKLCEKLDSKCDAFKGKYDEATFEAIEKELENFISQLPKQKIDKNNPQILEEHANLNKEDLNKNKEARVVVYKGQTVKTDGNIYFGRPKQDYFYVPYFDGKSWMHLNVNSLGKLLGLDPSRIKKMLQEMLHEDLAGTKFKQWIEETLKDKASSEYYRRVGGYL